MLEKGLKATSQVVVSESLTARAMGSGDMEVFATPAMVALMENAAMRAVAEALPEGATTVGSEMNCSH
ncbi:MAG: dihydrolipoamide acyltransferase, partial [Alistipes sp.]|nr:dihydrolipoamide acyltransferase [Alistipes sp.]